MQLIKLTTNMPLKSSINGVKLSETPQPCKQKLNPPAGERSVETQTEPSAFWQSATRAGRFSNNH
jgi:hypothetical protein